MSTKLQVSIPANVAACIAQFAVKKDRRTYLHNVAIIGRAGRVYVAANNGHVGGIHLILKTDVVSMPETPDFTVVVPAERLVRAKGDVSITADIGKAVYQLTCAINDVTTTDTIEDSYYPDIFSLFLGVDMSEPQEPAYFDFNVIEKVSKATRALTGKGPNQVVRNVLHQRGSRSVAIFSVEDHPDFIGLIMPLRTASVTPIESLPAWLPV